MSSFKEEITRRLHLAAQALEAAIDRGREAIGGSLAPGVEQADHIAAYRGYANRDQVITSGRVLANPPASEGDEDHSWLENLGNLWRRIHSREVPGAQVVLRYGCAEQSVETDEEGYYEAVFDRADGDAGDCGDGLWSAVEAEVPGAAANVAAQHPILTPPAEARFGVISDMDDTVIHTGATRMLLMARRTLFGNARVRQPLVGVAAFYSALQKQFEARPTNPMFYVSSSPWNLYDLLDDFLQHNGIPPGPLLLRDYGIDDTKLMVEKGHGHKLRKAERIMAAYPDLPFVLIGDSGQDDAEIYAEAARLYPDRIRAIYIRDVDPDEDTRHDAKVDCHIEEAADTGVPMLRARDSLVMAEHAAQLGLIEETDVDEVAAEVKTEERQPASVEEAIEAIEP